MADVSRLTPRPSPAHQPRTASMAPPRALADGRDGTERPDHEAHLVDCADRAAEQLPPDTRSMTGLARGAPPAGAPPRTSLSSRRTAQLAAHPTKLAAHLTKLAAHPTKLAAHLTKLAAHLTKLAARGAPSSGCLTYGLVLRWIRVQRKLTPLQQEAEPSRSSRVFRRIRGAGCRARPRWVSEAKRRGRSRSRAAQRGSAAFLHEAFRVARRCGPAVGETSPSECQVGAALPSLSLPECGFRYLDRR